MAGKKRYATIDMPQPLDWHVVMDEFQAWLSEQEMTTHDGDLLTTTEPEDLLLALFAGWASKRYEPPARKS